MNRKQQIFTSDDSTALAKHLKRMQPPWGEVRRWQLEAPDDHVNDHYTLHSLKRGAAAALWQAVADKKLAIEQVLLLLKHKDVESSLQYCPTPMLAAKAVDLRRRCSPS